MTRLLFAAAAAAAAVAGGMLVTRRRRADLNPQPEPPGFTLRIGGAE